VLVAGSALLAAVAAPPLLSLGSFDSEAFAALRETATATQVELPPFREWIVNLIPANPIRAAADGAMLPLIVFTAILALAILRLEGEHKQTLVGFFDAVSRAMLVIVNWILLVAPIGIDLIGAMGVFILVACGLVTVALLALYPVAVLGGGISLKRFARACAPAQAVGFSTRSSLASLPAMLEAAEDDLELAPQVTGIVLPVAVALLKYASPPVRITGTIFVAHLYGIDLGVVEIATIAAALGALRVCRWRESAC
jgi:Na+/H+-dicarboxylate symporter